MMGNILLLLHFNYIYLYYYIIYYMMMQTLTYHYWRSASTSAAICAGQLTHYARIQPPKNPLNSSSYDNDFSPHYLSHGTLSGIAVASRQPGLRGLSHVDQPCLSEPLSKTDAADNDKAERGPHRNSSRAIAAPERAVLMSNTALAVPRLNIPSLSMVGEAHGVGHSWGRLQRHNTLCYLVPSSCHNLEFVQQNLVS